MTFARPLFLSVSVAVLACSPGLRAALFPQGIIDHSLCCGPRTVGANAAYDPTGMGLSVMGAETLGNAMPAMASLAVGSASVESEAPSPSTAPVLAAAPTVRPVNTAAAAAEAKPQNDTSAEEFEQAEGGYLKVGFDRLSAFKFVPPPSDPAADANANPPTGEEQIPAAIKSLDGRKTLVTGFMLPVKMEGGLVTEFLLVKDPMMCCYGVVPNMNEWIVVKMSKGVKPLMDVPISFYGQLHVGAMFESGYMTGIYRLEGERMGEVQG